MVLSEARRRSIRPITSGLRSFCLAENATSWSMKILLELKRLLLETKMVAFDLFKVLIPTMVLVKLLDELGLVEVIGEALSPLMGVVGLPGEMGIVWGAAILTNIYAGIVTLISLTSADSLSIAQATVLGSMILICHSLPVETALSFRVSGVWRSLVLIRFLGAIAYGWLLHISYTSAAVFQGPASIHWVEQRPENSLFDWAVNQAWTLLFTVVVLFSLLAFMRILKVTGVLSRIESLLQPLLRLIRVSSEATSIAVIGLLAGITFGSGLLLAEIRQNKVAPRDVYLTLVFLSLCHGLIEDTSLMLLVGGDISGLLLGRLLFALVATLVISFAAAQEPQLREKPA